MKMIMNQHYIQLKWMYYKKLFQQVSIAIDKSEILIVEQESYKLMLQLQTAIKNFGCLYQ